MRKHRLLNKACLVSLCDLPAGRWIEGNEGLKESYFSPMGRNAHWPIGMQRNDGAAGDGE